MAPFRCRRYCLLWIQLWREKHGSHTRTRPINSDGVVGIWVSFRPTPRALAYRERSRKLCEDGVEREIALPAGRLRRRSMLSHHRATKNCCVCGHMVNRMITLVARRAQAHQAWRVAAAVVQCLQYVVREGTIMIDQQRRQIKCVGFGL